MNNGNIINNNNYSHFIIYISFPVLEKERWRDREKHWEGLGKVYEIITPLFIFQEKNKRKGNQSYDQVLYFCVEWDRDRDREKKKAG